jgi:hypothetical protein
MPAAKTDPKVMTSRIHRLNPGRLRRRCWRAAVAWYVALALIWPALGILPWLAAADLGSSEHLLASYADHDDEHSVAPHHHDASDVPGSPTHPADHDCFQCQVLKHLSRCIVSDPATATVPAEFGCSVQPAALADAQQPAYISPGPPIRSPPLQNA